MVSTNCKHHTFTINTAVTLKDDTDARLQVGGRWCPPYYDEDEQKIVCHLQEIKRVYMNGKEVTEQEAAAKMGLTDSEFHNTILNELFQRLSEDEDL